MDKNKISHWVFKGKVFLGIHCELIKEDRNFKRLLINDLLQSHGSSTGYTGTKKKSSGIAMAT